MLCSTSPSQATRNATVWMVILLLALLAWISTVQQSLGMPSVPGTMGMALGPFLVFWTIMMAAMMLPAFAPVVSMHLETSRQRTQGLFLVLRMGAFIVGYLFIWAAFGIPAFLLALLGKQLVNTAPQTAIGVGITLLVAAGFYQMAPLARQCLTHCNLTLQEHHCIPNARNPIQDVGTGLLHGVYCLGCCGGLMLILVAVGLMNLSWMIVITLVVFLEKMWRYGKSLSFLVGVGLVVLGFLAAFHAGLIPGFYTVP